VRVGAVDLGTNSTRLLVADVEAGKLTEVVRRLTITRLGEGVDEHHALAREAIERTFACLDVYAKELAELGAERSLAVATSAVRDAANGRPFLDELETRYGFATRLLDGLGEAELTFLGVTAERRLDGETLIVDIGGGSTELVLGDAGGVRRAASLQLGCVRLTERHLRSDPPSAVELEACRASIVEVLPGLATRRAIGVAGTVTSLAAIDLGLAEYDPDRIHGHRLQRTVVELELESLAALPLEQRRTVVGLEPARAPVIVAGALILREVLAACDLAEIEASERDILQGAALSAANLPLAATSP
jgi:exopolyphosphatase/guanosine-5'-triphosphate,3'-diphosphate pyrophosphatase